MPTPTIPAGNLYMNATLYTGNGSTQSITNGVAGQSFQPDFVWLKSRSNVGSHIAQDSVRGTGLVLVPSSNGADQSISTYTTSFNSNGFSVGNGSGADVNDINGNGRTYVGWQWKAGGTAVTNTSGSITSSVSANTTAGFSVVTWTGTGSNATVGHGLGVAPSMIINKPRNSADNWISWHTSLGNLGYLYLNNTTAAGSGAAVWNSTLPTSSVFSVGTSSNINTNGQTMVSYCWAEVAGFSKFGSYTGNGSTDGPFVYLGFRPKFILTKAINQASQWFIWDSARSEYNAANDCLFPESSQAETANNSALDVDFLSNGFKIRNTGSGQNNSTYPYIYMAFAENPFKYANAR